MKVLNPEKYTSVPESSFEEIQYIGSFTSLKSLPKKILPEFVLIGKSNVGKSSLINHLTKSTSAKISKKPGKTQTLNLYEINHKLYLMDLPGYGYAKVPKSLKKQWQQFIDDYFVYRKNLKLGICLFDSRHFFTEKDLQTLHWMKTLLIPIIFVFTKIDKLSFSDSSKMKQYFEKKLKEIGLSEYPMILYSVQETQCRKELIKTLNKQLHASS